MLVCAAAFLRGNLRHREAGLEVINCFPGFFKATAHTKTIIIGKLLNYLFVIFSLFLDDKAL
jgi:hypothetical protein